MHAAVKTFEVLFAFRAGHSPMSVSAIAAQCGLGRNQVFRCIKTLEALGIVREDAHGFSLTRKLLELVPAMDGASLVAVAEPLLLALRDETGETVNLVAVEGDETVCVATYAPARGIGLLTRPGQRSRLHAGAVPKAILAHMPEATVERVLGSLAELPRYTSRTVLDSRMLREELRSTRERGYSISDGDFEDGARGVGVPVFGPTGTPVGGISIGGPAGRVPDPTLLRFAQLALGTAAAISQRLGYRVSPGAPSHDRLR